SRLLVAPKHTTDDLCNLLQRRRRLTQQAREDLPSLRHRQCRDFFFPIAVSPRPGTTGPQGKASCDGASQPNCGTHTAPIPLPAWPAPVTLRSGAAAHAPVPVATEALA